MRLFQPALDTPLDSPSSATLSVHGLHFTVCAPSISEQFGPSIHKKKGFRRNSPRKVHPNFAENLGRENSWEYLFWPQFTTPPELLRRVPFFERENACKTQGKMASAQGLAIANHSAIVHSLRVVNLLRVLF